MKLMHLSDLHIGKRVNEFSMAEDQNYILDQILKIAEKEGVDGVLIAGDIYDKPIPTAEAVQILDRFLTRLTKIGVPAFLISGNHDSAERLAFGSGFMSAGGIYLSPVYDGAALRVCLEDEFGPVYIHLLPFLKPSLVRHAFPEEAENITGYQEAVETAVRHMEIDQEERNVLVAHQFVTGARRCDSEEVSVGGLDNIDAGVFDAFDYVALGHIHSPQNVGSEKMRYCGTPLKYSFSEAGQEKCVTIVELGKKGELSVKTVPLAPLRDMRKIRGSYMEVTARSFYEGTSTQDYLEVTLTDEEDIPDGLYKLRVIYPNIMRLLYDNLRTRETLEEWEGRNEGEREKAEWELFEEFYQLQNNQPMSDVQMEFVKNMIREMKHEA